jgi:hypothetical protein
MGQGIFPSNVPARSHSDLNINSLNDTHEDTCSAKMDKSSCRVPPSLQINHGSRVEALKCYKSVFATRLGHPVFFDFSKDCLWFAGDTIHIRLGHFLDSSSHSEETVKEY